MVECSNNNVKVSPPRQHDNGDLRSYHTGSESRKKTLQGKSTRVITFYNSRSMYGVGEGSNKRFWVLSVFEGNLVLSRFEIKKGSFRKRGC